MNWKYVTLVTAGLMGAAANLINDAANRHFLKVSRERALMSISEETLEKLEKANETVKLAGEIETRERKNHSDCIKNWKKEHNYDNKVRDIHQKTIDELDTFKRSIGYYDRKQDIEDEYDDAVEAYKESVDYDYETSVLEAEIEDAKNAYKKRCRKIDAATGGDDEISDALSDLKKSEKEKMDETVKEAKSKLSALKNKLATEENKLSRKKQQALRELENEIQATKTQLEKIESEERGKLYSELKQFETDSLDAIEKARSKEDEAALNEQDDAFAFTNNHKAHTAESESEIFNNAPKHERWAEYLKAKECPRWLVVFVAALPLIPVGFALEKYVKFVYHVVAAM